MRIRMTGWARLPMLISLGAVTLCCPYALGQGTIGRCEIPLTGSASGGTLIIANTLNRNCRFVVIETEAGESAESVADRLAQAIREQEPFYWRPRRTGPYRGPIASVGGRLVGLLGPSSEYMTAGTEVGLGIPAPPTSLTANYNPNTDELCLRWRNPSSSAYDRVKLVTNWCDYDYSGGGQVDGSEESYVLHVGSDRYVNVQRGCKGIDDLDV
jgi:hypothetical protein